jgi:hypothetical protein
MKITLKMELILLTLMHELDAFDEDGDKAGVQGVPEGLPNAPSSVTAVTDSDSQLRDTWREHCSFDLSPLARSGLSRGM